MGADELYGSCLEDVALLSIQSPVPASSNPLLATTVQTLDHVCKQLEYHYNTMYNVVQVNVM